MPAESKKAGSVEDTLLLLDMLKNMKQKDKEAEKVLTPETGIVFPQNMTIKITQL